MTIHSQKPNPHPTRAKRILTAHPEVRRLIGHNPLTGLAALCLVLTQFGTALLVSHLGIRWHWVLLLALVWGSLIVHALYAVIHETSHRLVFRGRHANRVVALLCNLPLVAPFAIALSHYHLVHHREQGRLGADPDLPRPWEERLFAGGPLHKLSYAILFPFVQLFRKIRPEDQLPYTDAWLITNTLLQVGATTAVAWLLGWEALFYLGASTYLWAGPHPVFFARFVQEHFVTSADGHETHSYYGLFNRLTFNIGYHVEHHDIPSVPWQRLPALRRTASSFYEDRTQHRSWLRLTWKYLTDRDVQVASRVVRAERAAPLLVDQPDATHVLADRSSAV